MTDPITAGINATMTTTYTDQDGNTFDVTTFNTRWPITLTAKWWMRPICWLIGKPTKRTIYR